MITIEQIRAARGLLDWSQSKLAEKAGLSQTGLARIESGMSTPSRTTLEKIMAAFDAADIEFIGAEGLKRRTGEVRSYKGASGFVAFIWDVYETAAASRGDFFEICVNNVDERDFIKWEGDEAESYQQAMAKLEGLRSRILIKEGDKFFSASEYADYRWIPEDRFGSVPYYIYGDKVAFIVFYPDDVEVFVINHKSVTGFLREWFERDWARSVEPNGELIKRV